MKKLDYTALKLSPEKEKEVNGLIKGTIDPEDYLSVRNWINSCYHTPNEKEQVMLALNEVLEGYGIKVVKGNNLREYWLDVEYEYINMGDTYTPTITFHPDNGWQIQDIGTVLETRLNEVK